MIVSKHVCCISKVPRRGALSCDAPAGTPSSGGNGGGGSNHSSSSAKAGKHATMQQPAPRDKRRQILRFFGDAPAPSAAPASEAAQQKTVALDSAQQTQQAADAAAASDTAAGAVAGADTTAAKPCTAADALDGNALPPGQWRCE